MRTGQEPEIEDTVAEFEFGIQLRRRRASYGDRVLLWVETWPGLVEDGCRVNTGQPDLGIGYVENGQVVCPMVLGGEMSSRVDSRCRRLPDLILASVRYHSGLWDTIDVTDRVLSLDANELRAWRDGSPGRLSLQLPESVAEIDICAAVSAFFGYPPDFDAEGAAVSRQVSDADIVQSRKILEQTAFNPRAG